MKKKLIFLAMSVVLLALGLALTGCATESSDDPVLPANLQNTTWNDGSQTLEFGSSEIVLNGARTFEVVSATENGSIVAGETTSYGYNESYYVEEEFCSSYSISEDGTILTLEGKRSFSGTWTRPSIGDPDLSGSIVISATAGGAAAATAEVGATLYAVYSGTETVSYQWYKNGTAISGQTGGSYTPTEAGSYAVAVSASGYQNKTSDAVAVTGGDGGDGGDLDGMWEGSKGPVIIFNGNTFQYYGPRDYSGTFTTSGSTITFTTSAGSASANFAVSGGTLTITNHSTDSFINDTYTKEH